MTVTLLLAVLILMTVGIWLVAIISLWYGRELLKRQRELTKILLPYLHQTELDKKTIKSLKISTDEPIEKYREVTLPDQVQVSFTERKALH